MRSSHANEGVVPGDEVGITPAKDVPVAGQSSILLREAASGRVVMRRVLDLLTQQYAFLDRGFLPTSPR